MNEMSKKLPVFTRTISRLLGTGVSSKVFISMIFYLGNYRTHVMIFPGQHTNIIGLQYYMGRKHDPAYSSGIEMR